MAEQSWYIKKYIEYAMHPKRFEYEAKKEKIMMREPLSYYLTYLTNLFFLVTFVLIGRLLVFLCWDYDDVGFLLGFEQLFYILLTVILGLVNIGAGLWWTDKSSEWREKIAQRYNKNELNELYEKTGVYEVKLEDIYKHKCGELDYWDNWICSATGEQISYRKLCECHRDGCRNCKTLSDVLYNSIDMEIVRENERKFNESKQLKKEKEKEARKQKETVSNVAEAEFDAEFIKLLQESPEEKKQKKKEKIRSAAFIIFIIISVIVGIILEKFGL